MLHTELWSANQDLARACRAHPFVRALADGTLPADAFRRFIAQDVFFLRAFLRAYAATAARSDDLDLVRELHDLMAGVLEELNLHRAYAQRLQIELAGVRPYVATRAYTDFLLRTAWQSPVGETLAAMTPCMRLYAWLGRALAPPTPGNPYADWIHTYAGPEFEALARRLEALLDRLAEDTPAVRDAYRYALEYELNFFAAPLEETA